MIVNLKNKTIFGTLWNTSRTLLVSIVDFVVYAVLARFLDVQEFALLAFCLLIVEFANMLTTVGINQNLIQRKKWEHEYFVSVFTVIFCFSLVVVLILASLGGTAAFYFYSKNAALVVVALSSMPFLMALQSIFSAKLERDFHNKEITIVRSTTAIVCGGLTLIFAFNDFGIWSIVIGKLLQHSFTLLIFWVRSKTAIAFGVQPDHLDEIKEFCLPLCGMALLNFFQNKGSNLFVASVLGTEKFAFISISKKGLDVLSQLTITSVNKMVVPSLARVKNTDKVRVFYDMLYFSSLIITPCFFGLGAVSEEFITVAFGDKYAPSAIYLTIASFAMSGLLMSWYLPNLLISGGYSSTALKLKAITFFRVIAISASTVWFGVEIMLFCITASAYIFLPLQFNVASEHYNVSLGAVLKVCFPSIVSSVLMVVGIFCIRPFLGDEMEKLSALVILVISGMIIYASSLILFFNKSISNAKKILKGLRNSKYSPSATMR
ncbi:lipopolysaccharide biosynthesis protein [Tenacibaculum sp. KUL152]|nr:lipopolysaccharide biosynthesis protein [Tenacibaculum sp. KUL152]